MDKETLRQTSTRKSLRASGFKECKRRSKVGTKLSLFRNFGITEEDVDLCEHCGHKQQTLASSVRSRQKRDPYNGKLLISETKKAKKSTLEESSTQIRRTSSSTFKF